MSLKSILQEKFGITVGAIEEKVAKAQADFAQAQREARAAAFDAEAVGTPKAAKESQAAQDLLAQARDRLQALTGALLEAKDRKARDDAADAAEADRKRRAAGRDALERLQAIGGNVDKLLGRLEAELQAASAVQQEARQFISSAELDYALSRAYGALKPCVAYRLRAMPGFGVDTTWNEERARWAGYLPEPALADRKQKVAA